MAFSKLTVRIKRIMFRFLHQPHLRRQILLVMLTASVLCLRASKLEYSPPLFQPFSPPEIVSEEEAQTEEEERQELFHPFPFPDELQPQVNFWRIVFTKYTTNQAVIHDDRYMNVIYEVIDLNGLNKGGAKKAIAAAVKKYENVLKGLAQHWDSPSKMTATEQQIHDLFKEIPESPYFEHKNAKDRIHAQIGQADRFKAGIIHSGQYMPAMQRIFAERGLPEKLAYLPLIESAFNPVVESHAGAAGMWQFMRGTGKDYKLKISNLVDERKDPLLATRAAAELLGHNYKVSASWPLAITAYNFGLQGIKNAAKDVGTEDIAAIIERYDGSRFGYASRNFYVEFLAAVDVCLRYTEYFGEIELHSPLALAKIKLSHYISPKTLEKHTSLTVEKIKKLNPALHFTVFHKGGMIPKGYRLNIPETSQQKFEAQYAAIPQSAKYAYLPVKARHRVKKGETLSTIAIRYRTPMKAITKVNGIKNAGKIRIGQILKIPGGYVSLAEKSTTSSRSSSKSGSSGSSSTYRIKKGETLIAIAKKHQTSVQTIERLNNISDPRKIKAGQSLKLPSKTTKSTQGSSGDKQVTVRYKVRKGQTLTMIAKLHNTSVKAIANANQIRNPRRIKAGQVLIIPKG
ncbi:MAG: LysM peptidoglycan-binding domain-containing protein [bacterium]|nr:LysM peptidoglycan-binding domain-containing protein [bacterium]